MQSKHIVLIKQKRLFDKLKINQDERNSNEKSLVRREAQTGKKYRSQVTVGFKRMSFN